MNGIFVNLLLALLVVMLVVMIMILVVARDSCIGCRWKRVLVCDVGHRYKTGEPVDLMFCWIKMAVIIVVIAAIVVVVVVIVQMLLLLLLW